MNTNIPLAMKAIYIIASLSPIIFVSCIGILSITKGDLIEVLKILAKVSVVLAIIGLSIWGNYHLFPDCK